MYNAIRNSRPGYPVWRQRLAFVCRSILFARLLLGFVRRLLFLRYALFGRLLLYVRFLLFGRFSDELGIKNDRKKVYWYIKAAHAGLIDAQRDLGYSYIYGEGVKKDKKKAVQWYKKAASKNDDKALYNLGLCYKLGEGVEKSKRWANYYFFKADEQGNKLARAQLRDRDQH